MDLKTELEKIEKYFEIITKEELEQNLKDCGLEVIESSSKKGYKLV